MSGRSCRDQRILLLDDAPGFCLALAYASTTWASDLESIAAIVRAWEATNQAIIGRNRIRGLFKENRFDQQRNNRH
jgi:hypothetical protein